jgi:ribosomal-protein-alanine N-acetyltransferase
MKSEKINNSIAMLDVVIETERLILRKLTLNDTQDMFEYTSDPICVDPLPWQTHIDIIQTKMFIENVVEEYGNDNSHTYGIEHRELKKLIGVVKVFDINWNNKRGEFSYILNSNYQGKGFANEAISALISFVFEKKIFLRIQAHCSVDNLNSKKLLEKLGMKVEGILKLYWNIKGTHKDVFIFGLLNDNINPK